MDFHETRLRIKELREENQDYERAILADVHSIEDTLRSIKIQQQQKLKNEIERLDLENKMLEKEALNLK